MTITDTLGFLERRQNLRIEPRSIAFTGEAVRRTVEHGQRNMGGLPERSAELAFMDIEIRARRGIAFGQQYMDWAAKSSQRSHDVIRKRLI